jgi:hypothetical protein
MPYIGKSPSFGVRNRFVYVASSGATSVSGADANGATLTFTDGAFVDVYLNGVLLKPTTDYNTSTANTIAGLSALNTSDEVTVVVYDIFAVADTVSATSGGTFVGNVTFNGDVSVGDDLSLASDGAILNFGADSEVTLTHVADTGLRMEDTDKFQLGAGGDLSLSHNGTNSLIANSTGALLISGDDIAMNSSGGESMFSALSNGSVRLYYDNVVKISTASNGMVLGGASVDQQIHFDSNSDWTIGIDSSDSGYLKISNSSAVGTTDRLTFQGGGFINHTANNNGGLTITFDNAASTPYGVEAKFSGAAPDNTTSWFFNAVDSSAQRFRVYSDGDVVNHDDSYGALSDERIKQDIVDANSQWDDIKAIKVRNFKKKDDVVQYGDKAWTQIGVIAQELEKVSPKLIKEAAPDANDIKHSAEFGTLYEDGDEIPEGKKVGDVKEIKDNVKRVSTSVLYMKAVKALQEAMTRIETLEAKVKTLEEA